MFILCHFHGMDGLRGDQACISPEVILCPRQCIHIGGWWRATTLKDRSSVVRAHSYSAPERSLECKGVV